MAGTTVADSGDVIGFFQKAFERNGILVSNADLQPVRGLKKITAIGIILEKLQIDASTALTEKIHEDLLVR